MASDPDDLEIFRFAYPIIDKAFGCGIEPLEGVSPRKEVLIYDVSRMFDHGGGRFTLADETQIEHWNDELQAMIETTEGLCGLDRKTCRKGGLEKSLGGVRKFRIFAINRHSGITTTMMWKAVAELNSHWLHWVYNYSDDDQAYFKMVNEYASIIKPEYPFRKLPLPSEPNFADRPLFLNLNDKTARLDEAKDKIDKELQRRKESSERRRLARKAMQDHGPRKAFLHRMWHGHATCTKPGLGKAIVSEASSALGKGKLDEQVDNNTDEAEDQGPKRPRYVIENFPSQGCPPYEWGKNLPWSSLQAVNEEFKKIGFGTTALRKILQLKRYVLFMMGPGFDGKVIVTQDRKPDFTLGALHRALTIMFQDDVLPNVVWSEGEQVLLPSGQLRYCRSNVPYQALQVVCRVLVDIYSPVLKQSSAHDQVLMYTFHRFNTKYKVDGNWCIDYSKPKNGWKIY